MTPRLQTTLSTTPDAPRTEARVVRAFADARAAQPQWAARPVRDRLRVLRQFRHRVASQARELAATVDRPESETLTAQILPLAAACRFLEIEAARVLKPEKLGARGRPLWLFGTTAEIHREPAGLILVIAPSNYPVFIPGTQILQALAAGNAVLLKPAPEGVASALCLAQLLADSGVDPRLVPVLPPEPDSAILAIRERPDHILFTGSSDTGRAVLKAAAQQWIPCTLELSGSDAVFVREDADLDLTARALVFGLRLNAGATCIAPRRVFAHQSIAADLESRLGGLLAREPRIALSPRQEERILPLLCAARARGARLVLGQSAEGSRVDAPIVVTRAQPAMRLLQEDLFAPILSIVRVENDREAIEADAQCPWALGASIFSRDLAAARELASRIDAGSVTLNDIILPTADPRAPFGGRHSSGYGVTRGRDGLLACTRTKVISVRHGNFHPHLEPAREGDAEMFFSVLETAHGATWRQRLRGFFATLRRGSRRPAATPPVPTSPRAKSLSQHP